MRLLGLLALVLLARPVVAVDFLDPHEVRAEIRRDGESWTLEYTFDRPAGAWLFPRTSITRAGDDAWRARTWTVETPGVSIERRGAYDVLQPRRGEVPVKVRVRFTPLAEPLVSDYTPAVRFSDGSVALFTGHFDLVPLRSAKEADRLPSDLNGVPTPITRQTTRISDGTRTETHANESPKYVFLGPTRPMESPDVVLLLDPELPAWIRDSLGQAVPQVLSRYAIDLGALNNRRPTIIVSWKGATPRVMSRGGGTLAQQIVMEYEGERLVTETPERRAEDIWFVAHEAAHFWLGQTVSYEFAREAWITEGGADLLAARVIQELALPFDWRGELQKSVDDCVALTRGRGVESARERNEHRAYYACGVVLGLIAEGVTGKPYAAFARRLIDANRADRLVNRADWLAVLASNQRGRALRRDVERLLDRGDEDPAALIASLFERAGVNFDTDPDGLPRLR